MSIELIVFESPEEIKQTVEEAEIADQDLYQYGFSIGTIQDLREMSFQKEETFIESDIANIIFSQVVKHTIPYLKPFESKKTSISLKKNGYSITLTLPERLTLLVRSKDGKKPTICMCMKKGSEVELIAADVQLSVARPLSGHSQMLPQVKYHIEFTNDKQIIEFSKNLWQIVYSYNEFCRMEIPYFFMTNPGLPRAPKIVMKALQNEPTPIEKILQVPNHFHYLKQYEIFLANRNLYNMYATICYFGEKSEQAAEIREIIKREHENDLLQRSQERALWHRRVISMVRRRISNMKYKKVYELLNDKEKRQVDASIKSFFKNEVTEGERLVAEMMKIMNQGGDIREVLKKLLKLTGATKKSLEDSTKFLVDNICPHSVYIGILNTEKYKNYIEKIENTHRELIRAFGQDELLGEVSCRICGEILKDNKGLEYSIVSRMKSVQPHEYDKLYNTIWESMLTIISRYIIIERSYKLQITKIVEISSAMIRNELGPIQSGFLKNRVMNSFQVDKIMDIYIYIYIFAVLTQLIFMNEGEIRFAPIGTTSYSKARKGGEEKGSITKRITKKIEKGKGRLQEIMNIALNFLRIIKGADIESSEVLDLDQLKGLYAKAYKWVYSLNYMSLDNKGPSRRWEEFDTPYLQLFERFGGPPALGRPKEQILKEAEKISIYETLKLPNCKNHIIQESLNVTYFYLNSKLWRETVIPITPLQRQYQDMCKKMLSRDQEIRIQNCIKYYKITGRIDGPRISRSLKIPTTLEDRCRCKKRSYIFEKNGKKAEFTNEQVVAMLKDKKIQELREFYSMKYLHEKCHGCKNQKQLDSSIESSFWDYFMNACPEGDFHDYDNKDFCQKCKINVTKLESRDKAYYQKYKNLYYKKRDDARKEVYTALVEINKPPVVIKPPDVKIQFNDKYIQQLTKEYGVNYNFYMNIGLINGEPFEKIQKGQINPFSAATPGQIRNRNNKIYGYIIECFATYNQIKYSEFSTTLPEHVEELLEKVNNKDFSKIIPKLEIGALADYRQIQKKYEPKEVSIFLLNELAEFIIRTQKLPKTIGPALMKYYIKYITSNEKTYAEYKSKGRDKEEDNQEMVTQGLDADEMSETASVAEQEEVILDDDIDYDPLSLEKVDMELDEDIDMDENLLSHAAELD